MSGRTTTRQTCSRLLASVALGTTRGKGLNVLEDCVTDSSIHGTVISGNMASRTGSGISRRGTLSGVSRIATDCRTRLGGLIGLDRTIEMAGRASSVLPVRFLRDVTDGGIVGGRCGSGVGARVSRLSGRVNATFSGRSVGGVLNRSCAPRRCRVTTDATLLAGRLHALRTREDHLLDSGGGVGGVDAGITISGVGGLVGGCRSVVSAGDLECTLRRTLRNTCGSRNGMRDFAGRTDAALTGLLDNASGSKILLGSRGVVSNLGGFTRGFSIDPGVTRFRGPASVIARIERRKACLEGVGRGLRTASGVKMGKASNALSTLLVGGATLRLEHTCGRDGVIGGTSRLTARVSFVGGAVGRNHGGTVNSTCRAVAGLSSGCNGSGFTTEVNSTVKTCCREDGSSVSSVLSFVDRSSGSTLGSTLSILGLAGKGGCHLKRRVRNFLDLHRSVFSDRRERRDRGAGGPSSDGGNTRPRDAAAPSPDARAASGPTSRTARPRRPVGRPTDAPRSPATRKGAPANGSRPRDTRPAPHGRINR